MNKINDGGAAFPSTNELSFDTPTGSFGTSGHAGMTLRDYFAAKALNVILQIDMNEELPQDAPDHFANKAYELADAMLKARQA